MKISIKLPSQTNENNVTFVYFFHSPLKNENNRTPTFSDSRWKWSVVFLPLFNELFASYDLNEFNDVLMYCLLEAFYIQPQLINAHWTRRTFISSRKLKKNNYCFIPLENNRKIPVSWRYNLMIFNAFNSKKQLYFWRFWLWFWKMSMTLKILGQGHRISLQLMINR